MNLKVPKRTVAEQPYTQANASPDAFGAGIGRATQNLGGAIAGVGEQGAAYAAQRKQQNDTRTLQEKSLLMEKEIDDTLAAEVMNATGEGVSQWTDKPDGFQKIQAKLEEIERKYSKDLSGGAAERFRIKAMETRFGYESQFSKHIAAESNRYATKVAADRLELDITHSPDSFDQWTVEPDGFQTQALNSVRKKVIASAKVHFARQDLPTVVDDVDMVKQYANARVNAQIIGDFVANEQFDKADAFMAWIESDDMADYAAGFEDQDRKKAKDLISGGREVVQRRTYGEAQDSYLEQRLGGKEYATYKEFNEANPAMDPAQKLRIKDAYASAKSNEPIDRKVYEYYVRQIAAAETDPFAGDIIKVEMQTRGISRESYSGLYAVWDSKFKPGAGGAAPKYANQKSLSHARLAETLRNANVVKKVFKDGKEFSEKHDKELGPGDKPHTLSAYNAEYAKELDAYDTFLSAKMDKGVTFEEADAAYWQSDRMVRLQQDGQLANFLKDRSDLFSTDVNALRNEMSAERAVGMFKQGPAAPPMTPIYDEDGNMTAFVSGGKRYDINPSEESVFDQ